MAAADIAANFPREAGFDMSACPVERAQPPAFPYSSFSSLIDHLLGEWDALNIPKPNNHIIISDPLPINICQLLRDPLFFPAFAETVNPRLLPPPMLCHPSWRSATIPAATVWTVLRRNLTCSATTVHELFIHTQILFYIYIYFFSPFPYLVSFTTYPNSLADKAQFALKFKKIP